MLQTLAKLLKALNSEASPAQISLGLVAGIIVGLTPLWSLHNLLVVFLVLTLRVNLSAFMVSWALFSGVAYLLDPLMATLGEALLTNASLKPLWTAMYDNDFWRLAHYNNTLTLGSLVASLATAIPLFFVSRYLIVEYRLHVLAWVRKMRFVQVLKATRFYRVYEALSLGSPS